MFPRLSRISIAAALVLAVLLASVMSPRSAAAAENRILLITKSALYGGAAGLLLGGVLTLVVDSDSRDDVIRWGIVVGTFSGFAYGIYEITHGEEEFSSLVQRKQACRPLDLTAWTGAEVVRPRAARVVPGAEGTRLGLPAEEALDPRGLAPRGHLGRQAPLTSGGTTHGS